MIIRLLLAVVTVLCCMTCGGRKTDELECRPDMKNFCKEWIENCDNSRCDEEDYRKNCHPRLIFVCE